MAAVILWAAITGDILVEGRLLIGMPWGVVSLVDLYSGFLLIIVWIWFRERAIWMACVWSLAMLVLGNFAFCSYVFIALATCNQSYMIFFLGKHADQYQRVRE